MENASKALYMVAGILVGMIIIGMFVYLFKTGGKVSESYDEKQNQEQLLLFNSKFENFDKSNNTIIDMVTVTNLAIDTNEENEFNNRKTVAINIKLGSQILRVSDSESLPRNYLFQGSSGDKKIYVYDLLDKNKKYLCTKKSFPTTIMQYDEDTLSMVNKYMVYKYLFKSTDIQYHETTGRVKYMEFELVRNGDF